MEWMTVSLISIYSPTYIPPTSNSNIHIITNGGLLRDNSYELVNYDQVN